VPGRDWPLDDILLQFLSRDKKSSLSSCLKTSLTLRSLGMNARWRRFQPPGVDLTGFLCTWRFEASQTCPAHGAYHEIFVEVSVPLSAGMLVKLAVTCKLSRKCETTYLQLQSKLDSLALIRTEEESRSRRGSGVMVGSRLLYWLLGESFCAVRPLCDRVVFEGGPCG
jgi:hypothetical protein